MATTEQEQDLTQFNNSDINNHQGDANTLSPMESNHHVIKNNENTKADLMTMSTPPHLLSVALGSTEDGDNRPPRRYYNHRNSSATQREREERVRKMREMQEEERKKKIEELKQHAIQQQKFREQQEFERKRRMEEARAREHDKFIQVEERRKAIVSAEKERREALLKKNQEREDKISAKRRAQQQQSHFAFGSSTPRMGYPMTRTDSDALRGSSTNMMSQSMYSSNRRSSEREMNGMSASKRATSAHGLDQNNTEDAEGDLMSQSMHQNGASAHRRRTDLMPTITLASASPGSGLSRSSTPGTRMLRSPGRSPSALSGAETPSVKLRPTGPRRPRPISIATTGVMSTSMFEKRSSNANTPTRTHNGFDKSKTPSKRPVTKSVSTDEEGSVKSSSKTPSRKTPAQVKAESAARKAKVSLTKSPTPPIMQKKASTEEIEEIEDKTEIEPVREATPDIIRKSPVKEVEKPLENNNGDLETPSKKIITSEEEAKARLAEKRREMKEKMEREAEAERQRQLEIERLEAEKKAKEEEEERKAMEEADRLAAEARKAEEERLQKAIEEAKKREEEEKRKKEEEELKRKEAERKAQEEMERKQAELDEKLKKEEEERLARKKRLDEIMARTRGAKSAATTPKKEAAPEVPAIETSAPEAPENNGEHSSLDPAGDPTKPDLLGDIAHVVPNGSAEEENKPQDSDIEKGIVDMNISEQAKEEEKIMNAKNEEASLMDLDSGSVSLKQAPLLEEDSGQNQPEFDQILDLTNSNEDPAPISPPPTAAPLIAFEDSITPSPKQEVPTADLLS